MARTAKRHIVTHTVVVGAKAQQIDALAAQKRHTGFVGFCDDPGPGEVLAKVRADLRQDVDHSAGGGGAAVSGAGLGGAGDGAAADGSSCEPAGSIVRFTPLSASK